MLLKYNQFCNISCNIMLESDPSINACNMLLIFVIVRQIKELLVRDYNT